VKSPSTPLLLLCALFMYTWVYLSLVSTQIAGTYILTDAPGVKTGRFDESIFVGADSRTRANIAKTAAKIRTEYERLERLRARDEDDDDGGGESVVARGV